MNNDEHDRRPAPRPHAARGLALGALAPARAQPRRGRGDARAALVLRPGAAPRASGSPRALAALRSKRPGRGARASSPARARWRRRSRAPASTHAADGPAAVEEHKAARRRAASALRYEKRLAFLGTLGNNAPFVGLFGTVLGIIRAFHDLAGSALQGTQAVMAGIAEALVATGVGLLVALPAVADLQHVHPPRRDRASPARRRSRTRSSRTSRPCGEPERRREGGVMAAARGGAASSRRSTSRRSSTSCSCC